MPSYSLRPVLTAFLQHEGLAFAEALPEQTIKQAFADEGIVVETSPSACSNAIAHADSSAATQPAAIVYTAAVTLWAFLSQVLFKGEQRSCLAATARVVVLMATLGRRCSDNTGAYCRARAKLPLAIVTRLTLATADGCEARVPEDWLWHKHHVHLVDGSTSSMPDTPANQAAFPQARTQQAGLGFPIARMVVLLSLATGMLTGMAMGPYRGKETGETALFRELLDRLKAGDVVLADRYYCSYFMVALLQMRQVHIVTRLHQRRPHDFCRGRDHLVTWQRPAQPAWMDDATYAQMPATLTLREVHVQVQQPGFRVRELIVVTTLLDAQQYPAQDIGELYHQRWLAELDIRTLKVTLNMDVLRCLTPEMVRKEIWTCLLAYNLIRQSMLEAALAAKLSPRQLSFAAALQKIAASWAILSAIGFNAGLSHDPADSEPLAKLLIALALSQLAMHRVADRPNRIEPRANKRRPKAQKYLTKPRAEARAELLGGSDQTPEAN